MRHPVIDQVAKALREGTMGKLAAAQLLESLRDGCVDKAWQPDRHAIALYWHCKRCLVERPSDVPANYARLSVGFTREGLQVWCWRHGLNVMHVHFEGAQHAAHRGSSIEGDAANRMQPGEKS